MNKTKTTGNGDELSKEDWRIYRDAVYACLFYSNQKWPIDGPTTFFDGQLIHYSDFMKAKRGSL